MEDESGSQEPTSKTKETIEFKKPVPVLIGRRGKLLKKTLQIPAQSTSQEAPENLAESSEDQTNSSQDITPGISTTDETPEKHVNSSGDQPKISQDISPEKSTSERAPEKSVERSENKTLSSADRLRNSLPPAVLLKEMTIPVPYKEPKWSGLCPEGSEYALDVLKCGMIMQRVDLSTKPYFVCGRLSNCDVIMTHPTISRHHAVLQYKAKAESESEPPVGWYVQDLGSTHGSFLNKQKLKPFHYVRVKVGHQIKFGTSTRSYILLGPDSDSEMESELSLTVLRQRVQDMKSEKERKIQEEKEQREIDIAKEAKKKEEQGIDWGMGEDAEDETDLSENPYASTANEELYLTDPKKTLRGFFEREGHELTYGCEERGQGQFICRVELPLDDARGRPVMAEAIVTGKKKQAVIACALEACRILDRAGLLRQAKHESRRRKERDWSADDYYDSDDDTFLDRTGSVEKRRQQRMKQQGAEKEKDNKALTYDDLLKQISAIEARISTEEQALDRLRASNKPIQTESNETDALDDYMNSLGKQGQSMATKAEISVTKMAIQKLKSELSKTRRLADLARPAHLPPLIKKGDAVPVKKGANSVVYGKRIRLKEDLTKRERPKMAPARQDEGEFVEEVDSDDELDNKQAKETVETLNSELRNNITQNQQKQSTKSKEIDSKNMAANTESKKLTEDDSKKVEDGNKKVFGPMRPPANYVLPENYFEQESDRDLPEIMEDE